MTQEVVNPLLGYKKYLSYFKHALLYKIRVLDEVTRSLTFLRNEGCKRATNTESWIYSITANLFIGRNAEGNDERLFDTYTFANAFSYYYDFNSSLSDEGISYMGRATHIFFRFDEISEAERTWYEMLNEKDNNVVSQLNYRIDGVVGS